MDYSKVAVITGGTSGIGRVAARHLANEGMHVVLMARNADKAHQLMRELRSENTDSKVSFIHCDLGELDSVQQAADEFLAQHMKLHLLINNAGAIVQDHALSADGLEMNMAVNHFGHFLLTQSLMPMLKSTPESRVVVVSSEAHKYGHIDLDDVNMMKKFSGFKAYSTAKLANLYFTYELHHRLHSHGVTVNALHPGFVSSGFGSDLSGVGKWLLFLAKPFMISAEEGAETLIYLSTSDEVKDISGKYFKKKKAVPSSEKSRNAVFGKKFWELSEKVLETVKSKKSCNITE
jgi:NAD(P)-dependent dehydrogenase (short-subunit alcohol dehydrogenase family)